ncbi:MAG TPA: GNAT family N-acetyltransferase [Verrucomicrobiota bacterium]|nr:GNAT family N-acetyltransferase [Verrucomicrobiota bacterium]
MYKIELISRVHDREGFDCGSEPLNACFRQTARHHTERGISRTFVMVEEEAREPKTVLGFFTLNICQIRADQLSAELARKLPREVAGIKLGRLAVAASRQRQGLGKLLLVAAMNKVVEVFESAGGIGLFVDAKDEAARGYYQQFGFMPLPDNPLQLFLPLPTLRKALEESAT